MALSFQLATYSKLQGRVFAANSLVLELVSAIIYAYAALRSAILIAGVLSDKLDSMALCEAVSFKTLRFLEPAMQSETILTLFAPIFGHSAGAGMALLYVFCAIAMFCIGAIGFKLPQLHQLENTV